MSATRAILRQWRSGQEQVSFGNQATQNGKLFWWTGHQAHGSKVHQYEQQLKKDRQRSLGHDRAVPVYLGDGVDTDP
jgi:hypothetical protein